MSSSSQNAFASLSKVKSIILVLSGKGGVGKSTIAVNLAHSLVNKGKKVGILDVDLTGPSVPRMVGLQGKPVHKATNGWVPVYTDSSKRLAVMSIAFLLANQDDPIVWRGPKKTAVIKQFLQDVIWDELDFLIVDTPPGTSDEHIATIEYLQACNPDGAVIVTTPQMVSIADVRKELTFCRKVNIPILGIFENMSGYVCPHCSECTNIFSSQGGRLLAEEQGVPYLGSIPIDSLVLECEENGEDFIAKYSDSSHSLRALQVFADKLTSTEARESHSSI